MEPEKRLLSTIFCDAKVSDGDWGVFGFIEQFMQEHGHSPTSRDIMRGVSLSAHNLIRSLRSLRRAGVIGFEDGKPRTIVIFRFSLTEKGETGTMFRNPYPEKTASNNHRVWQEGCQAGWNEAKGIVQKVNAEADDLRVFKRMILLAFVPQKQKTGQTVVDTVEGEKCLKRPGL